MIGTPDGTNESGRADKAAPGQAPIAEVQGGDALTGSPGGSFSRAGSPTGGSAPGQAGPACREAEQRSFAAWQDTSHLGPMGDPAEGARGPDGGNYAPWPGSPDSVHLGPTGDPAEGRRDDDVDAVTG